MSAMVPSVSGFTMIRNGVKFDYPFLESWRSLLPWVDELVIAVGRGEDATWEVAQKFAREEGNGKVVLFETDWNLSDPERKKSGLVLSEQTNLALARCKHDWCFYLQADEVLHEADREKFLEALRRAQERPEITGLLFDYVHFYGSYDVVQVTRSAYRREVRVVRRSSGVKSVGDAQSFRLGDGEKPPVLRANARVFHYGWVRTPEAMREKTFFMDQLYHGDPTEAQRAAGIPHSGENYRYKRIWGLRPFRGEHPLVMRERIKAKGWHWDLARSPLVYRFSDLKKVILDTLERVTGARLFEYRSYRLKK